jgi:hypothetical protein
VDGRPGDLDAVLDGLALGVEARERRQQRRMDVQDPTGEAPDELDREHPHVPGRHTNSAACWWSTSATASSNATRSG